MFAQLLMSDPCHIYAALLNTFKTRIRILVPLPLLTALGADSQLLSQYITKRKIRLAPGMLCQVLGQLPDTDDTIPLSMLERLCPGITCVLDVIPYDLNLSIVREVLTRTIRYINLESALLEEEESSKLLRSLPFILLFDYVTASMPDSISQVTIEQTQTHYYIYVRYHTYRSFIFIVEVRRRSGIVDNVRIVTPDGGHVLALYEPQI